MFVSRERRPDDRFLYHKLASFGIGAALALVGIALRSDLLVTIAIAVLAAGILLRFLGRRAPVSEKRDTE